MIELGIIQYESWCNSNDILSNELKYGKDTDNVCFGISFNGFKVCLCAENSFSFEVRDGYY